MEVVQKYMLETSTIPKIRDNTNAFTNNRFPEKQNTEFKAEEP